MPGSIDFEARTATTVALLGRDYRGVNFELLCAEGDEVKAGAAVMRDARRPELKFTAPAAGRIARIERGARRKLVALRIEVDATVGCAHYQPPAGDDRDGLREFMLESGAWSCLRTRPFGNIPNPGAEPAAIFVTALDAEPMAPEPAPVIDASLDEFNAALSVLTKICSAPLYLCQAPGHAPELAQIDRLRRVAFRGGYEAGLPGVHINALCPIGFGGGEVWHLGYQDAIALGQLVLRGTPWLQRVISIGGNAVKNPRSLLVPAGAAIDQLLADELVDGPTQILAGSSIYGRPISRGQEFLAAGQRQITVLAGFEKGPETERTHAGVLIPSENLERLAPPGIYAVPLMRALQLGDAERARELGVLELVEEDVAPLSHACVSNNDYGRLLRRVLDRLEPGYR